ncbi:MAG: YraN family protein [Firmicutes bacterium]|nr:YraN family protein [Bacillota bacterium]
MKEQWGFEMNNLELGKYGEELAAKFLKKNKHKILEQNIKLKTGEIDIIAFDKIEKCICFIEVKTRIGDSYGLPREAVGLTRQHRYRNAAISYLKMKKLLNAKTRFDVIEILDDNITHIKNAF